MTSFSATCSRFSQFLKDQQRLTATARTTTTMSLLPGLDLSTETEPDTNISTPDRQPMELFPLQPGFSADASAKEKADLTIFYGGQMLVFADFPAEKARDLMKKAGKVDDNSAASPPPPPTVVPAAVARGTHLRRRACLNRFMEKRRERIHSSKAPYQVDGSATQEDSTKKPAAALPWFLRDSQPASNSVSLG